MSDHLSSALRVIDRAWDEVSRSPWVARDLGRPIDRLPEVSEEAALAMSERARSILNAAEAIDAAELPAEVYATFEVARAAMLRQARSGDWYWLVFDPLGVGFYAMFSPTAYGGGFLLSNLAGVFGQQTVESAGDQDRRLALVEDYARLIRQLHERCLGQAERGIHMPVPQLEQAVTLVSRLRGAAERTLVPAVDVDGRVIARVRAVVDPAFACWLDWLRDPVRRRDAPSGVGLGQYPGGAEVYRELVEFHLTFPMTPEAVHAEGLTRVAQIRAELEEIAGGDIPGYLARMSEDPRWRASGADAITGFFRRYIERLEPHLSRVFRFAAVAGYGVEPLDASLAASMTFGYYDAPSEKQPTGRYRFNAGNLERIPLGNVAALTYHELVPGHHFHIASQRENPALHPLRSNAFFNAFNEGYAEYAAHLAGELGMYEQPEERFGKLTMEAFLTCRLVVDTGMNVLGWTLEQGREYLRENAFISEEEVASESIRYSCDIPAQSLGYKMGDRYLLDLRDEMRGALGDLFDLRDFHDAVLRPGGLPLPLVARNVRRAIRDLAAQHSDAL